jgi:SSS family solute:Na+ symporter
VAVSSLDLFVLGAYLAGVVLLGLWVGRGQKGASDYMLGDRNLPWWGLLFSIVATETSTVTFLSIPGFGFARDLTWIQLALGFMLGRFLVIRVLLPGYFAGRYFTAYQVLHERFGPAVRQTASSLFIATRSLADGLRLFLTALVVQELSGLSLPVSVALVGLTTLLYTFFGGMRAVVFTDVAQFAIYVGGAALAFGVLVSRLPGGWPFLLRAAGEAGKLHWLDLAPTLRDPYVLWAGLVGGTFLTFGSHGVDQLMVQRYLCARSRRQAAWALGASGVVVLAQFAFFLLIGVGLFVFYRVFPPATPFDRADRVFAHFIVRELPTGTVGLVIGAVFAAAMSTLSGSLNSSATALVTDFYLPRRPETSPQRVLQLTRLSTLAFAAVQMTVALAGSLLAQTVVESVLTIAGFTTGITLGVFCLGVFAPRVGQGGALVGLALGLVTMCAVAFLTPLAWPWYTLVGASATFALGLLASRLGG